MIACWRTNQLQIAVTEIDPHRSLSKEIVIAMKENNEQLLDDSLSHHIVQIYEQIIERKHSRSNTYYQICPDLTDGYLGMAAHQLNHVMQPLTIITVVFVPLTLMARIYGMNFEYINQLSFISGYIILLGVMLFLADLQVIYFRRKRWS
jgi:magnesium transporter